MDKYLLLVFQIIAHLSLIPLLLYGEPIHYFLVLLTYFFTGCFGMTMTYHRGLAHKSWKMPTWWEYFGTVCGTYGLTGSSIGWVGIHREHHHYTDEEQDPHSPHYKGFFRVQFLSMFEEIKVKYITDLARDDFHKFLHRWYFLLHFLIALGWALIDPMLLISCYLAQAALLWNFGSGINTINHLFGYRLHNIKDHSTNNLITGYLMWGEGWHNNHHNDPKKSNFGEKWWEVDVGGALIHFLENKYPKK